jgi:hypothetical protein
MERSGIAPVKPPPGGRKHHMLDDSMPVAIHATSPNCHNDHASEGAYGFSDLRDWLAFALRFS